MSSFTSYVVIVAGDELVLVGDQLHLVLHPQVVSQVVAVPKNLGTTELKEKHQHLDIGCRKLLPGTCDTCPL